MVTQVMSSVKAKSYPLPEADSSSSERTCVSRSVRMMFVFFIGEYWIIYLILKQAKNYLEIIFFGGRLVIPFDTMKKMNRYYK